MSYLENRGHIPSQTLSGGRLSYLCPMPWHNETKPSFVVWTNSEYENFYCFGCQSKHNIIHLVASVEGIPARQAIEKLSDGIEFGHDSHSDALIKNSESENLIPTSMSFDPIEDLSATLIDISSVCRKFLKSTNHDPKECERINKLWKMVDTNLRDCEFEKIEIMRSEIKGMLLKHKETLYKQELENKRKEYENDNNK